MQEMNFNINILGTKYLFKFASRESDKYLAECDGYCDKTSNIIAVLSEDPKSNYDNYKNYQKKVVRHEIIHAYLNESGLQENYEHSRQFGHDETMIDWFAIQLPKINRTIKEVYSRMEESENISDNTQDISEV